MVCAVWAVADSLTRVYSKMDGHVVPTVGSEQPPVLVEDVSAYFEVATMETTGGKVWDAARALLQFFRARPHLLEKGDLPLSLVELGSGTGFLGMSLAREFEVEMTLTEMIHGGALRWLERNVQRNRDAGLLLPSLRTAPLDWSWVDGDARAHDDEKVHGDEKAGGSASADAEAAAAIFGREWQLVIGSDLVYNETGARMLPRVLSRLLGGGSHSRGRAGAVAFYAHTLNRFEFLDKDFFGALRAEGLRYEQAWPDRSQHEQQQQEEEEPFFGFSGDLFPEMRVVVFRIEADPDWQLRSHEE